MGNDLGQRYGCETCGTITMCIKTGSGRVHCCGRQMALQAPRELPSAD